MNGSYPLGTAKSQKILNDMLKIANTVFYEEK